MVHKDHEASQFGEGNAGKKPMSSAQLPKSETLIHSSRANPLFRAMQRYLESGDWERSSLLLENLLERYPQDRELLALRQQLHPHLQKNTRAYESNPLYRAIKRHQVQGEWSHALTMVNGLLQIYPQDQELRRLRQQLHLRLQLAKRSYADVPLYRAMQRHIKQEEWAPALVMVHSLLASYPQASELLGLREKLQQQTEVRNENRSRKWLLASLGLLLILLTAVCGLFYRYIREPVPLAQMVAPRANLNYPPHYLFSIYDVAEPSGVGVLSDGERIYVAEMAGERMVRIFDRKGIPVGAFAPQDTLPGERAPVYLSTDSVGNVYVTDRLQHAVFIFDRDGVFIDALLGPDLTLSEYVSLHAQSQSPDATFTLNLVANGISSTSAAMAELQAAPFELPEWSPLGIRIDRDDRLILTDVTKDKHRVYIVMLSETAISDFKADFDPLFSSFGASGSDDGEFLFPNAAVADSLDRIYVSDGNNGRISVWGRQGDFLYDFGGGTGDSSFSLPRGLAIDDRDRLHVVDTVGQTVKVYDVSGSEPEYLFAFGDFGLGDGLFNYPNDIAMDDSGRLYIADRDNNRVQVWSY